MNARQAFDTALCKAEELLPVWLPREAHIYITGAIISASLEGDTNSEKERMPAVLPAFCDFQMENVWKKIESLSESSVFDYTMAIASGEANFSSITTFTKLLTEYKNAIEKNYNQALVFDKSLKQLVKNYSLLLTCKNLLNDSERISNNLKNEFIIASDYVKNINRLPAIYGGWVTRKKSSQNASMELCIRSLSDAIRRHTKSSLYEEIATTVNVLFNIDYYDSNNVKKLVGAHPQNGNIRTRKKRANLT